MEAQVLGLSVDSVPCLKAWADSLGGISYPLLSDFYPHGHIARMFGVFRPTDGFSERAILIVDKTGRIRYVNVHDKDQQPNNDELFEFLASLAPQGSAARLEETPLAGPDPTLPASTGVTMYCTPWCPACRRARAYLKENGVEFTEIDISRDRTAAQRVRGWANGNETTPTFDVKGTIVVDFDKFKLAKALGFEY